MSLLPSNGRIARWLSPQNQPYCKWGSSIKWRCCPPFVDHFFFFETEGRHASGKAQEAVDHLASFMSSREKILKITSYIALLSKEIHGEPLWLVKFGALLEVFLHPCYTTPMNGQSGTILYWCHVRLITFNNDLINGTITLTWWWFMDEK